MMPYHEKPKKNKDTVGMPLSPPLFDTIFVYTNPDPAVLSNFHKHSHDAETADSIRLSLGGFDAVCEYVFGVFTA